MDRQTLIDRTHKLMQLANSDNPNEAAMATAKAQALITQYNIEQAELEAAGKPADPIEQHFVNWPDPQNVDAWEKDLVSAVADAFFCTIVYWPTRLAFIGRTTDSGVAEFVWQSVRAQFLAEVKGQAKTQVATDRRYGQTGRNMKKWKRDWLLGAVAGVREQLDARHTAMSADRHGTALVLSRDSEIENFMTKAYPKVRLVKRRRTQVGLSYYDGVDAGKRAQIETGFSTDRMPTRKQLKSGA